MERIVSTFALAAFLTAVPAFALQAAPAPPPGTIHHRDVRQQKRIGNGVKSGRLTAHETRHLENREVRIHREARRDRSANGGHLTAQERRHINRQQNRTSRQIYRDKHNNRVQR